MFQNKVPTEMILTQGTEYAFFNWEEKNKF
jgi:hypothetical protein